MIKFAVCLNRRVFVMDNKGFFCPPTMGEGNVLFLVQIQLASTLALASHFLVCTISCETVVEFLPNFHGEYNWDITKN